MSIEPQTGNAEKARTSPHGLNRASFRERFTELFLRVVGSWTFMVILAGFILAYAALNVVLRQTAWDPYPFILLNLFLSMGTVLGFVGVLIILKRMELLRRDRLGASPSSSDVERVVESIFDSDEFLTTLRSTLPVGLADSKRAADFIPFLLNSIDERRRRASKEAALFLGTTIATAFIFSGVVVYFGYILVNEASAGSAKYLG